MKPIPVSLERYFFTVQSVIANPDHDANNAATRVHLKIENSLSPVPQQKDRFGIEVSVSLDKENSNNAPYDIRVTAFGIIKIIDGETGQNEIDYLLKVAGAQMMIGIIRERIAEMTSRGPWPITHLNFVPIQLAIDNDVSPE